MQSHQNVAKQMISNNNRNGNAFPAFICAFNQSMMHNA